MSFPSFAQNQSKYTFAPIMKSFKQGHYEGLTISKSGATFLSRRFVEKIPFTKTLELYIGVMADKERNAIKILFSDSPVDGFYRFNRLANSFSGSILKKEMPIGRYLYKETDTDGGFILVKE